MGKRYFSILLTFALVGGVLSALPARAQDAASEGGTKFFLRTTGCPATDVNSDFLSLEDADDGTNCIFTGSGIRNEIGGQTGTVGANGSNVVSDRETATRYFDATDGVPIVLDASKPVTGEIWTQGTAPLVGGPAASVGQVIIDFTLVGTVGDTEIELGAFTDTFTAAPTQIHKTDLEIALEPSLTGTALDTLELRIWKHGASVGHGMILFSGAESSYLAVPTASAGPKLKPAPKPGKNDPPGKGKKKGCPKGKGKKKGACPGKKPAKPKPPAADQCEPYAAGDLGKEAALTVVTAEATEDKPIEVPLDFGLGIPENPNQEHVYHNVQVAPEAAEAGLYVRFEFAAYEDMDLYLYNSAGEEAAHAAGYNPAPVPVALGCCDGTGSGGHSERGAEVLDGIRTSRCGGYTVDMRTFQNNSGTKTLKLWLGEPQNDPAAPPGAFGLFYDLIGL